MFLDREIMKIYTTLAGKDSAICFGASKWWLWKQRYLCSRTIFEMFAKNSSQTFQVRSRSALVLTWLQSDTSQSRAQKITLPQILPPPWQPLKSIITCERVFLIVFASRIHLAPRKHRWIFLGLVYYDATNVNFTENPLTSTGFEQTDSLLSQRHLPRFQNALRCTIFHLTDVPGFHQETFSNAARKTEGEKVAYASMHPLSMIQSSTHALTPLPDSSNRLFALLSFSLCFYIFARGAKVSCAIKL